MSYLSLQAYTGIHSWKLVDPWSVFCTVLFIGLSVAAFNLIKLEWRMRKTSKILPSKTVRFPGFSGNASDLQFNKRERNGLPFNTSIMQVLGGYSQLFKEEKLFCLWLSYVPFVCAIKAQAVEEMISGTKMMQKSWLYQFLHPWLGEGLLTSHGSKWKSRRKLLTPSFHFDILKDFLPTFNERARDLVRVLQHETTNDFTNIVMPVTLCSLDIICETTLGVSISAQDNKQSQYVESVQKVSDITFERMIKFKMWPDFTFQFMKAGIELKKHIKILHNFTLSVIQEKKRNLLSGDPDAFKKKRMALMDLLLEHHIKTKTLTEEDIREEVDTFAFEGHDTTSMGMTWALYLIGLHKNIQSKVHEELDRIFGNDLERPASMDDLKQMHYLERVFKESQRLYPSVPMIGRQATEDITVCGKRIPKGSVCAVLIHELHRDESVFPEPEKFDPDRFLPDNTTKNHPFAYIPFSAGPRNCIGQRFAVLEEKVVVSTVLRYFQLESLDQRDHMPVVPDLVLRPVYPVRVKIRPRVFS